MEQVGRNRPCPCGSGVKFKKCCGRGEAPAHHRPLPALELAGPPNLTLRGGHLVFDVPHDVTFLLKRLPGRRFDWLERVWTVPAGHGVAPLVDGLLAAHPELTVEPVAERWLARHRHAWRGIVTLNERDGRPLFVVYTLFGERPPELCPPDEPHLDVLVVELSAANAEWLGDREDLELDPAAAAARTALRRDLTPMGAWLELGRDEEGEGRFELTVEWAFSAQEHFEELPEARVVDHRTGEYVYREQTTVTAVPADPALAEELRALLDAHPGVQLAPAAERRLAALERERARAEAAVALSHAEDAVLELPPLGGELRPFQRAGVAYVLEQRRTFLADEQGLGKTMQALAALEADGAFPAAVVCPASMKLVWQREIERWLPGRSVAVLRGRAPAGFAGAGADAADIVVCNYDIVEAHGARLAARGLRAAVFDESHYCKDARRNRTKASIALSGAVAEGGLRLALTGTPILNRPSELVAQLQLLDRVGDFGSGAALRRRFRGAASLERLHWNLRAHCYVRRTKAQVLPQLPPKRVATVPVELSNLAEYRLAEDDVVAWLRTLPLDLRTLEAKVAAALRAEQLVRLNHLRRLAAVGKLRAGLGWIADFVATGEPLVVFAHHRDVQRAVCERFPEAGHILGDDSPEQRAAAVDAFQAADGPPLVVCSLQAASQGITLTRASNVAFLQLDWTPARHDQAEDRCHRIGQHDAVTAYYLLAPDSIDDAMTELISRKRGIVDAVTDGREFRDETVIEGVVRALRGDEREPLRVAA